MMWKGAVWTFRCNCKVIKFAVELDMYVCVLCAILVSAIELLAQNFVSFYISCLEFVSVISEIIYLINNLLNI